VTLPRESVWDYPRPPALERAGVEVVVELGGTEIARTSDALRVLETSHPPTYYLPREAFAPGALRAARGGSFCEWKGSASYLDVVGGEDRDVVAERAGWFYPVPTRAYAALADHVALYPGAMDRCTVDGETVAAQPGGFYGGWVTPNLVGPFKGEPGTLHW